MGDLREARTADVKIEARESRQWTVVPGLITKEWLKGSRAAGSLPQAAVPSEIFETPLPPPCLGGDRLLCPPVVRKEVLRALREKGFGAHSARVGGVEEAKAKGVPSPLRMRKARHRNPITHAHYGRGVWVVPEEARLS